MKYLVFIIVVHVACVAGAQVSDKLKEKAVAAEAYCNRNGFNNRFCFLIDMSVHSGKNRFFIYDFRRKKITGAGLVCHGTGKSSTETKPVYSNDPGSNCTSLGKYKLGIRSYSQWGIHIHYKMHGLEKSNSNAFKRNVVLHSYDYVPEDEIYPSHLTLGWSLGCPVISNQLMTEIDKTLRTIKKPTLLWIFE